MIFTKHRSQLITIIATAPNAIIEYRIPDLLEKIRATPEFQKKNVLWRARKVILTQIRYDLGKICKRPATGMAGFLTAHKAKNPGFLE